LATASYEVVGGAWRVKLDGEPVGTYQASKRPSRQPLRLPYRSSERGKAYRTLTGPIQIRTIVVPQRTARWLICPARFFQRPPQGADVLRQHRDHIANLTGGDMFLERPEHCVRRIRHVDWFFQRQTLVDSFEELLARARPVSSPLHPFGLD
jgi:hypothetical protein